MLKTQVIETTCAICLVVALSLVSPFALARPALAFSPISTAAATNPSRCDLPDGSSDGHYLDNSHNTCCPPGTNDAESCIYGKYVNPLIDLLAALVGVVVVIAITYGAIEYITSAGDPKRIASAKQHITNALLGLGGFILLYAVLQFLIPGGKLNG